MTEQHSPAEGRGDFRQQGAVPMSERRSEAEFHFTPSGHFVFSEATWERVKATFSNATVRDDRSIAGQTGMFSGTPVYIDRCPWDCHSAAVTE